MRNRLNIGAKNTKDVEYSAEVWFYDMRCLGSVKDKVHELLSERLILGNLKASLGGAHHAFDFGNTLSGGVHLSLQSLLSARYIPEASSSAAITIGPRLDAWLRPAEVSC